MTDTNSGAETNADVQAVDQLHKQYLQITERMGGVIVGQEEVIEQLLAALLCRGHCILEGVPGLAKTLMVSTLSSLLNQTFRRIQFTPDLMPADITGTDILEEDRTTGKRVFRFVQGPLFGNMILADEINRTPPKTQSALLEATQERQLTVGGQTYPLPEAQLDRFMLKIQVEYPTREQEIAITKRGSTAYHYETGQVLTVEEILAMQDLVRRLPVGDHVYAFAVDLVRRSRPTRPSNGDFISQMVTWGAGPRACIFLVLAAKARAILQGRYHATTEDIAAMALPVLRHRLIPSFHAEAAGQNSDYIIQQLIAESVGQSPEPPPPPISAFSPPPRIQVALSKLKR